ncbi:hypothetical protein AABB24_000521 [Solanum stoloniferum]|uniref:Terpene synthase metal-binding domain-containing protein n=1 Tax=Solanum stoloniferum TaxID=62892 RepID=A0ABD2VIJ3_9SOLN
MESLPVGVQDAVPRRSANYHKSIWGDYFLHNTSDSMMKKLIRAYFDEAKWYHSDYSVPTFEEYIKVSLVSSGYMMVATISLVGIEDNLMNKYIMDWVTKEPLVVKASTVIARLMDDIAGHEVRILIFFFFLAY